MCFGSTSGTRTGGRVWRKVSNCLTEKVEFRANGDIACLNPAWNAFVGCHLHRDILKNILDAGEWENPEEIEVADDPDGVLPRIWGVLRKKI